ncbi:Nif3-like dinuclear metal center hexameric protein [Segetibacter aerophilus]|uniref:GTP cyclohydrolase 1 type 2 homolog n=1 Tax=Segetibacter aerophilus TaxID=670293 RepID=A0A512BA47_9BACT|nr:Nif3-like dinuclear metal center hexameric protein [Segetibacter aerophilus]GEO08846.1 GTP cyclohydrolase 1 type 2 [Segetibacter aerophilus]
MKIKEVLQVLDELAPSSYQESYDNAGLIAGDSSVECTAVICTLDATEEVILEAKQKGCNLVVAHHPIIFSGLKKLTGKSYVERAVITAIKNDIAIYAIHTNLDNLLTGVNGKMADKLNLQNRKVLLHKQNNLMKLIVFVPVAEAEQVREAIFSAGGGNIGKYSECSFIIRGKSTFTPGHGTNPHTGQVGKREVNDEEKIEIIFPAYLKEKLITAMTDAHPYEEVAYDIIALNNYFHEVGSGLIGDLPEPIEITSFLKTVKRQFGLSVIRHTPFVAKEVQKVALCGGAGSFLIKNALSAGADVYITGDVKYHEFFDAEAKMVLADIGHWESEQFTVELLHDVLHSKFPTFAVLKSEVKTNPVNYFVD